MSWGLFARYCDQAVAYRSTEMLTGGLSLQGFNAAQLQADLSALPAA